MAPKYHKIDPRVWTDEKFRQLSMREKLLAIYILSNNRMNRIGLYVLQVTMIAEDLHADAMRSLDQVPRLLAEVQEDLQRVVTVMRWQYDVGSQVIFLPNWWRYNRPTNVKHLQGCLVDYLDLPENPFQEAFLEGLARFPDEFREPIFDTLCDRVSYRVWHRVCHRVSDRVCHRVSDRVSALSLSDNYSDSDSGRAPRAHVREADPQETETASDTGGADARPPARSAVEEIATLIEQHQGAKKRGSKVRRDVIAERVAELGEELVDLVRWIVTADHPVAKRIAGKAAAFEDAFRVRDGVDRLEEAARAMGWEPGDRHQEPEEDRKEPQQQANSGGNGAKAVPGTAEERRELSRAVAEFWKTWRPDDNHEDLASMPAILRETAMELVEEQGGDIPTVTEWFRVAEMHIEAGCPITAETIRGIVEGVRG